MADVSYRELSFNGLWKNNPAIVQWTLSVKNRNQ